MSDSPQEISLAKLAKRLREQHAQAFSQLSRLQLKEQAIDPATRSYDPGVPDAIGSCLICGAKRHEVRWEYFRTPGADKRLTRGGTCFCCVQSRRLLQCSRSPCLVRESGALEAVLSLSALKRQRLAAEDVCECDLCLSQAQ